MKKSMQEAKKYAQATKSNFTAEASVKMIKNVKQILHCDNFERNKRECNLIVKGVADMKEENKETREKQLILFCTESQN